MDKQVMEAVNSIDFESMPDISDDVRFKILTVLFNPSNIEMLNDLSINEIKLLVRLRAIAEAYDDNIKRAVYIYYLKLKNSNERKSRTRIEEMGIQKLPQMFGDKVGGLFNRFRKREV